MASIPNVGTRTGPPVMADRYVDFSDIVGGALVATAISLILLGFGSALGLSFASAQPGEGISLRWVAIGGGLWLIWTAVSSGAAGGYFAGRMRKPVGDADADEIETRDGAHGIAVWALATLIMTLLGATGVGGTDKGGRFGSRQIGRQRRDRHRRECGLSRRSGATQRCGIVVPGGACRSGQGTGARLGREGNFGVGPGLSCAGAGHRKQDPGGRGTNADQTR